MKVFILVLSSILLLAVSAYLVLETRNLPIDANEELEAIHDQIVVGRQSSTERPSTMNKKEFIYMTMQAIKALPKIRRFQTDEDKKKLSVLTAARVLDDVLQKAAMHPEFLDEALNFYRECASASQVHPSARAICYWQLKKNSEQERNLGIWASREMKLFLEISEN